MNVPKLGDIVLFNTPKTGAFHDAGWSRQLPGVVVKVWDSGLVNLQVAPSLDLNVLQNGTTPITFVPFVKYGDAVGEWKERP